MAKKNRIPHKFQPWIDARSKFKLSNAHIQMARELGMNPKRFGGYAPSKSQPWKLPLPEFIESWYLKRFGKTRPEVVHSMEELAKAHLEKRAAQKAKKALETLEDDDASRLSEAASQGDAAAPNEEDLS